MAKKNYKIPFDSKGNMLSYNYGSTIEKDNYEFKETLEYDGYGRGRSSATIHFKDSKGHTYSMFLSDFDYLMKSGKLVGNKAKATWTFCKKGSNFGVKLVN